MSAAALTLVPRPITLLEHVQDVDRIADTLDALDDAGELTAEREAELQAALIVAITGTREKVDRCAGMLASFASAEALASAEADRLKQRAARLARQRDYLERTVLAVLDASSLDEIAGNTATLKRRKMPARVEIVDEALVPVDFLRWPPEPPPPDPEPDKRLIAAALKSGAEVAGARLAPVSYKLVRS